MNGGSLFSSMSENHKVFVYGTLKSGYGNNRILEGAVLLGRGYSKYKYEMYCNGSFPYVIPGDKKLSVLGEVWEVNDKTLERLDWLEGHPTHYKREVIEVQLLGDDNLVSCSMYLGQDVERIKSLSPIQPNFDSVLDWSPNPRHY